MGQIHRNTHTHTHTQIHRGPLLLMHDQSIMHSCAFTVGRTTVLPRKGFGKAGFSQDCGNSQIPSYSTKDGWRAVQLFHSKVHLQQWMYHPRLHHRLSLSLMQQKTRFFSTWTACKTLKKTQESYTLDSIQKCVWMCLCKGVCVCTLISNSGWALIRLAPYKEDVSRQLIEELASISPLTDGKCDFI